MVLASSSRLHFMNLQCFTIDSFHSFAYYCLISTSLFHLHLCYKPLIRHPNDELFKDFVNFLLFPWSIIHCYQSYFFAVSNWIFLVFLVEKYRKGNEHVFLLLVFLFAGVCWVWYTVVPKEEGVEKKGIYLNILSSSKGFYVLDVLSNWLIMGSNTKKPTKESCWATTCARWLKWGISDK